MKILENCKHLDDCAQRDGRYQFRHLLIDKISYLSIFKSLGTPIIKATHIPLILLALVWSLPAYAGVCDYEDVPNLLDTVEVIPKPAPPTFNSLLGMTEEEQEAMLKEFEARMNESEKNMFYRNYLRRSFDIWAPIDCRRQINAAESLKSELELYRLRPPYDKGDAGDIILDKVVRMAQAGSGVEEIQKMVQKTFREFVNREKRGESINW